MHLAILRETIYLGEKCKSVSVNVEEGLKMSIIIALVVVALIWIAIANSIVKHRINLKKTRSTAFVMIETIFLAIFIGTATANILRGFLFPQTSEDVLLYAAAVCSILFGALTQYVVRVNKNSQSDVS